MTKARIWSDDEVEAVVADYFAMYEEQHAGRPFVKAQHTRELQLRLDDRTKGAVEHKRCNISAALAQRGLDPLPGYVPEYNMQASLADAVDAYLETRPQLRQRLTQ